MFETESYQNILDRMLDRIPDTIDKREGSIIYDALAPAAAELAQMYIELEAGYDLAFADTADGEFLSRRTAEFGVNRMIATPARRQGVFFGANQQPLDLPLESRFNIGELTYRVINQLTTGVYTLECEIAGEIGNQLFGDLLPIDHVPGLVRAELADVLVPGQDEETDEALRQRYYEVVNEPAFGGNVADYKHKLKALNGVGAVKVFPTWQGGGTVKCTVISSNWTTPTPPFINEIQAQIDPETNQGQGTGLAPIGHRVTIAAVESITVNIETKLTLEAGLTLSQIQQEVEEVIEQYLNEQRQSWAEQEQLIIRVAQIDAHLLSITGVVDVEATTVNGLADNLMLAEEEIPVLGTVSIYE